MLSSTSSAPNEGSGPASTVDSLCDFLEVFIHAVLCTRRVYPVSVQARVQIRTNVNVACFAWIYTPILTLRTRCLHSGFAIGNAV
ncbi:hypothetical protein GQ54DRAFT_294896 [Martensiomyces pterosporus]|nr:hypothetical protein GQ54DRAFT_294896 [Martensiomyces pterosporus]